MGSPLEDFTGYTRARIGPAAGEWLERVPAFLRELTARWGLTLGEPFRGGVIGFTMPAERGADGEPVVLKLSYPDGWFADETRAIAEFAGGGMVRLLDHDADGAQLMERASPGTSLLEARDELEGNELAAGVLRRLWRPTPDGFVTVAEEATRWADSMPLRHVRAMAPFERPLLDLAVETLRDLVATQGESVLLHGDLHHGNVLAAEREPWLAIDPKPLVGEREFDVTALLRDRREDVLADPDPHVRLQRRFDQLSELFNCDRRRLREWSFAILVDYALWDFEVNARTTGSDEIQMARLMRSLEL
ncbi:MAG: aminoglycoside phosphotransferase family protein [Actinomycetota bacterium]